MNRSIRPTSRKSITFSSRDVPITLTDNRPQDRFNIIYILFIYQGAALLFPYNAFIFLVDFYREKFCQLNLLYWSMVATILCTSVITAFTTLIIADRVSIAKRNFFGHILFIFSLLFFLVFSILAIVGVFDTAPANVGYIPLLAGFTLGIGSGITQPTYYGLSSLLPSRYTQALVVGETVSGLTVACFRVGTKLLKPIGSCAYYDTIVFIVITMLFMVASLGVWLFIFYHKLTRYCMNREVNSFLVEYRVLDQQREGSSFEEDESVIAGRTETLAGEESPLSAEHGQQIHLNKVKTALLVLQSTVRKKALILKKTFALQLTLLCSMLTTLFLFPTFLTAAYPCQPQLCDWGPIITLCVFMLSDFSVRWFSILPVKCSDLTLFVISLSRVLFIPAFALFIFPVGNPIIPFKIGFGFYLLIVAGFGITNGYFASVPLVLIPGKLQSDDKESGGTIGIVMVFIGLAAGTLLALPFNETVLTQSSLTSTCCMTYRNTTLSSAVMRNNSLFGECHCAS